MRTVCTIAPKECPDKERLGYNKLKLSRGDTMDITRRGNGEGSVYKLSGKRSRPYAAVITANCEYDRDVARYKQKRVPIGYYRTRDEAIVALYSYRRTGKKGEVLLIGGGKETDGQREERLTVDDMYQKWSKVHYQGLSDSMIRTWRSAYTKFEHMKERNFREIKPGEWDECIRSSGARSSTRQRMKSLVGQLYRLAIKEEIVSINYGDYLDSIRPDPVIYGHVPFTDEELHTLWQDRDAEDTRLILIAIYTGLRPSELAGLTYEQVDLRKGELCCGSKTDAGRNRIVPVHPEILPFIRKAYEKEKERENGPLFRDKNGKPLDYYKYRQLFLNVCQRHKIVHRPHDTRHTFITLAKEDGVNEYVLKLLVGHVISDLTERVYTHRKPEVLHKELEKIKIRK